MRAVAIGLGNAGVGHWRYRLLGAFGFDLLLPASTCIARRPALAFDRLAAETPGSALAFLGLVFAADGAVLSALRSVAAGGRN